MSDATPQRPTSTNDREGWKAYWASQRMPWRTEPEIDEERQRYLAERRIVIPDIKQSIYPFKDISLQRADLEWLLATHEEGVWLRDWTADGQGSPHHGLTFGEPICAG